MRLVGDRAPGQDAVGRAENLARRIGIEIGRVMAQTLHWPRHHAVEASAFATSSSICMKISGGASAPPALCGNSAR